MLIVESKSIAIVCMLVSLILLGTMPAIMTLLERRGRLPHHTYLDFSIATFFTVVLIAITFGQIGGSSPNNPNFFTQLSLGVVAYIRPLNPLPRHEADTWPCVLVALLGGTFVSLGNVSIQYGRPLVGLSVSQVVTSSIGVVIGATSNYFLDDKINNASTLFPGVACFFVAVFLASAVHSSNSADNMVKLRNFNEKLRESQRVTPSSIDQELPSPRDIVERVNMKNISVREAQKAGTADFIITLENQRAMKVVGGNKLIGKSITMFAGIFFSLVSPTFNIAVNDQLHFLKEDVPHLVVYTALFYFSLAFVVMTIILNVTFLYFPVLDLPKSCLKDYLCDGNGRAWAVLAGLLCGFGNGLQFVGGQAAGYAASDAVKAVPLVSTLWGILYFGEYRRCSKRTHILLMTMLVMFSAAVALLLASAGQRKTTQGGT